MLSSVQPAILLTPADPRLTEGYAKLSLKKYSPIAARNDDLKALSGRRYSVKRIRHVFKVATARSTGARNELT